MAAQRMCMQSAGPAMRRQAAAAAAMGMRAGQAAATAASFRAAAMAPHPLAARQVAGAQPQKMCAQSRCTPGLAWCGDPTPTWSGRCSDARPQHHHGHWATLPRSLAAVHNNSHSGSVLWAELGLKSEGCHLDFGQELDLKVRQFEALLHAPAPLAAAPNLAALWARLLVEELCRLGANTFCVAPGQQPPLAPGCPVKEQAAARQGGSCCCVHHEAS